MNITENCYKIRNARSVDFLNLPVQSLSVQKMADQYTYKNLTHVESYELADPGILIGLDATNGTVVSKKRIVWTVHAFSIIFTFVLPHQIMMAYYNKSLKIYSLLKIWE